MTGLYLTDLADVLRAAGLTVTEQEGWQTRARGCGYPTGRPSCVMWHHAASAPNASAASVANYASYGSDNAPVCNLVLGRDGAVIVCAAGATNTNGKGGPITLSDGVVAVDDMNRAAIGVEAVNTGTGEPWPAVQVDAYFAINNACAAAYGFLPSDAVTHAAWRLYDGSKIDPATAAAVEGSWRPGVVPGFPGTWDQADIRAEAVARSAPTPPTPLPPGDDDMRAGPFLIQATGADGTPAGRVYATDGNAMTLRWLPDEAALEGYRWQATQVFGWSAPELNPGAPIQGIDTLAAFGVIIE